MLDSHELKVGQSSASPSCDPKSLSQDYNYKRLFASFAGPTSRLIAPKIDARTGSTQKVSRPVGVKAETILTSSSGGQTLLTIMTFVTMVKSDNILPTVILYRASVIGKDFQTALPTFVWGSDRRTELQFITNPCKRINAACHTSVG